MDLRKLAGSAPQTQNAGASATSETRPPEAETAQRPAQAADGLVPTGAGAPVIVPKRGEPMSIAQLAEARKSGLGRGAQVREQPAAAPVERAAPARPSRAAVNEQNVRAFFDAYSKGDPEAMNRKLAPSTVYEDPVFPHLEGPQVSKMWKVVAGGSTKVQAELNTLKATDSSVSVDWVANYKFLGAPIQNHIHSTFQLDPDGKITSQKDTFDWRAWGNQTPFPANLLLRTSLGQSLVQSLLGLQIS